MSGLSPIERHYLRYLVSSIMRDLTADSVWGNCSECGGEMHPMRFTIGCKRCKERQFGMARRGSFDGITHRGLYA